MGRITVKEDWIQYVPQAFGQRAGYELHLEGDPKGDPEPITLEVHFLSTSEYARYTNKVLMKKTKDSTVSFPNQEDVNRSILAKNVRNIRNYSIKDLTSGRTIKIETGEQLYDHGESEICNELLNVINDMSLLEAGDLGKLQRLFGGTPPGTSPSAGTATNAGSSGSTET